MRKGYNTNGTFIDTGLLRDHVSKLRSEKKIATQLRESLTAMRNISDPEMFAQYKPILRDVDQLCEYLTQMARLLDNMGDEAVQLSHEIGRLIEDNTVQTRHVSSSTIML